MMRQPGVIANEALKGRDQSHVVFSRLEVSNGKNEGRCETELLADRVCGALTRNRPKLTAGCVWNYSHVALVQLRIAAQDRSSREIAARDDPCGDSHCPAHCPA